MLKARFSSRRNGDREVFFWSLRFEITTYFDVLFFVIPIAHNFHFWPTFQSGLLLGCVLSKAYQPPVLWSYYLGHGDDGVESKDGYSDQT